MAMTPRIVFIATIIYAVSVAEPVLSQSSCSFPRFRADRSLFLTELYTARLAWLSDGKRTNRHYPLDDCHTIALNKSVTILFFNINNYTESYEADDAFSFVGVQVIRIQEGPQKALDILIERNDEWTRDGTGQGGFTPKPVENLKPQEFYALSAQEPFDDARLKYKDIWWHATPNGASVSSIEDPKLWISPLDLSGVEENRILVSNRLYRYQRNSGGNKGVEFAIGVAGTERLYIRYFSPGWPDFIFSREIRIERP
jgi:hypothetical protein